MDFKNNFKVHNEWDRRILKSSEGNNRYYRVFVGDVTWKDGIERLACIVSFNMVILKIGKWLAKIGDCL